MTALKQSFAWWCVAGKVGDPAAFLRAVKALGYAGVELLPRELWDMAREIGLVIASEGAGPLQEGWNRREHHAGLLEEVAGKLELARRYAIPNLIVFSGNRAGLPPGGAGRASPGEPPPIPAAPRFGPLLKPHRGDSRNPAVQALHCS